jgi:hypothetical protein
MANVDWTDPACKVSNHFTVKEALWLPSWGRLANEEDGLNNLVKMHLLALFAKMDVVRDTFKAPIIVTVAYRPKKYNEEIGGAVHSAHMDGMAVDFVVENTNCDDARKFILPRLDTWFMRCEDKPGSIWVHLDNRQSLPRYFKP